MSCIFPLDVRPVVRTNFLPGTTVVRVLEEDETNLRELLAREVAARSGLQADEVEIVSRPGRKPSVEIAGLLNEAWHVSLSYTRGCCAGALSYGQAIGLDVEWIDPGFRWEPVATEFFPTELAEIWKQRTPCEASHAFYRHWVRWEAALKCHGTGFGPAHRPAATAERGLDVFELEVKAGYAGCVALRRA